MLGRAQRFTSSPHVEAAAFARSGAFPSARLAALSKARHATGNAIPVLGLMAVTHRCTARSTPPPAEPRATAVFGSPLKRSRVRGGRRSHLVPTTYYIRQ